MEIGTLNQRITILEHRTVIDEIGNHITKWEETFSLWAKVTVKTASETTDAGVTKGVQKLEFLVRQSPATMNINSTNFHILFRNSIYNVTGLIPNPKPIGAAVFLPDDAFLRNGAPMTKEEVRAVIISKLRLQPDSIVWDLGAGTGSVSITCAKCCPYGQVYAVEYQEQALDILRQNCAYLQAENVTVLAGRAETVLSELPVPDCIFIGGSNGAFPEILRQIQQLPKPVRLVVSAVTLETQAEVTQLLQDAPQLEIIPVFSGQSRKVGRYHVLQPYHPVLLFVCTGGKSS